MQETESDFKTVACALNCPLKRSRSDWLTEPRASRIAVLRKYTEGSVFTRIHAQKHKRVQDICVRIH